VSLVPEVAQSYTRICVVNVQEEIDASAAACVQNTANVLSIGQPTLFWYWKNSFWRICTPTHQRKYTYRFYYTILKHVSQKKLILDHLTLSSTVHSWYYLGLTTWILSDNATNF